MKDHLFVIKNYLEQYMGTSIYLIIFLVSLVYVWLFCKEKRKSIVYPTVFLGIVITNPWLYQYLWKKLLDNTYWRIFWTLPLLPVIAYAVVHLIGRCKKNSLKTVVFIIAVLVIIGKGNYIYSSEVFSDADNAYKLPEKVEIVADALLDLDEEPKVVLPASLYCYMRQYNGKIKMMYGRNVDGYIGGGSDDSYLAAWYLNNEDTPIAEVARLIRENKITYWVGESGVLDKELLEKYGFLWIKEVAGYDIFCDGWNVDDEQKWCLEIHVNEETGETFVTITDCYDRLLVLDGGSYENADFVRDIINERGDMVSGWIITNLSNELSGAYFAVSNDLQNVRYREALWPDLIENSNYLDIFGDYNEDGTWFEAVYDRYNRYKEWNYNIKSISQGGIFSLIGLNIKVLNGCEIISNEAELVLRDSSLVIQMSGGNSKILYISNVTREKLYTLIENYGEQLESDYLIWNCQDIDLLPLVNETVKAREVISLGSSESHQVEIGE